MVKTIPNSIVIKGDRERQIERNAGGAITPGDLVELTSSDTFVVHNTADAFAIAMFAVENDIGGQDINDDYASGTNCLVHVCRPGDEVLATLENGQNVAVGALLSSAGNGNLKAAAESTITLDGSTIAIALEAKDMSGSSGVDPDPRFRVLIK